MRVLVVDDDPEIRGLMVTVLSYEADVVTAQDGQAALRVLADETVDLVLLDVMMPGVSGFGVLEAIRADPRLRSLPVMMLTAKVGESEHAEAFRGGADAYLTKPFDLQGLLGEMERLMEAGPTERAARRTAELERAELLGSIESSFEHL
jgi:DNA-binding response OmpR family regulator